MMTMMLKVPLPRFSELEEQLKVFEKRRKTPKAQRLKQRTEYDIEMLREMGYTNGVRTILVT